MSASPVGKAAAGPEAILQRVEWTVLRRLDGLLHGDYALDTEHRERIQKWVQELWAEKDQALESLRVEWSRG